MPPESPRRPNAGWRGTGKPADRSPAADPGWKQQAPGWKKSSATPKGPWRLSWRARFGLAFGSVLGLVVGLIVLILYLRPPQPAALVLIGSGYETNLSVPHNAHGWQGLNDLADWSQSSPLGWSWFGTGRMKVIHGPARPSRPDDWTPERWSSFREKTLVVFLSLHGAADDKDGYFLLDNLQDGKDDTLTLTAVLNGLKNVPSDRNIVLVLEATQLSEHWPSGFLHNDLVRQLKAPDGALAKAQEKRPNLLVLCASDVGQRSWVSDEWGRSIYTHYFLEGLKGAAKPDGGMLDLLTLHKYVAERVERWARDNRSAVQTPLLLLHGSDAEAAARDISFVTVQKGAQETKPAEAPHRTFSDAELKRLDAAWKDHDALKAETPPPVSAVPVLWRQYEATLLRCEQLTRAGAASAAEPLFNRVLPDLLRDIEQQRRPDLLTSRINSLALPVLLGTQPTKPEEDRARKVFDDLWLAKETQRGTRWSKEIGTAGDDERLRLLLANRLVERVAGRTAKDGDVGKAYDILRVIDRGNDRPIEAQVLAMYGRDLEIRSGLSQPAPSLENLQLVLETCRTAERTVLATAPLKRNERDLAPYAEAVYPWVRERLRDADELRRKGENRMFASGEETWQQAAAFLRQAQAGYRGAQERGDIIRRAHAIRDEVADWLPWYARYRAVSAGADKDLIPVEELARTAEKLQRLLETPPEGKDATERDLKDVAARTDVAERNLKDLQEQFQHGCNELTNPKVDQSYWSKIDAALLVPSIEARLRHTLLEYLRKTGTDLNERTATATTAPPFDTRAEKQRRLTEAQRQGRMALAALGDRWVVECSAEDPMAPKALLEQIEAPGGEWQGKLNSAGERIGFCWRRAAGRVSEIYATPEAKEADALREVLQAARLGRLLDGGGAYLLGAKTVPDPALELRRLRLRDFLYELARRTADDHWWSESGPTPYYSAAGKRYLADAEKMTLHNPTLQQLRVARLKEIDARLRETNLGLENRSESAVADKGRFVAQTALQDDELVPRGEMVVWLKSDRGTEPVDSRRSLCWLGRDALPAYPVALAPGAAAGQAQVTVQAQYRGQLIECPVSINVAGQPDLVVYRHPPAPFARIAAVADPDLLERLTWEQMRIAIVFDCSGSMVAGKRPTRKDEALAALRKVLSRLPAGPKVSVWVFGHSTDEEDKVRRLLTPRPWTPDLADEYIAAIREVRANVNAGSPIARAVIKAAITDLQLNDAPRDVEGARVLLLLTDGEDNHFVRGSPFQPGGDLELNPRNLSVAAAMEKRFKGRGVRVFVAGYQLGINEAGRDELKSAREQFGVFETMDDPPTGKFMTAKTEVELIDAFEQATAQQPLFLRAHKGNREAVELTRDKGTDLLVTPVQRREPSRVLDPDFYTVSMPPNLSQRIELRAGDVLVLQATGKALGRRLFVDDQEVRRFIKLPQRRRADWVVAVQQAQLTANDRGLNLLVSAEKVTERFRKDGTLQQVRPEFVWFDLHREGKVDLVPMTVRNVDDVLGYPGPTWRLEAPSWKEEKLPPALPRVRQWVYESSPVNNPNLSKQYDHVAGTPLEGLFTPETRVVNADVSGLEVRFEKVDVEVAPGVVSKQQPAMVVRLMYPKESPVVAQLQGLGKGAWHRLYSRTNNYTGVFWPVTEAEARAGTFKLSLLSIKAIKEDMAVPPYEVAVPDLKLDPPLALGLRGEP